jgi:GT2 family glycosyltransferase
MLSVIVIHFATLDPLSQTLAAFSGPTREEDGVEVIVVDNATVGPLEGALADLFPSIRFLFQKENAGFGRAANAGARVAKGESLLFLNGDCFLTPEQAIEIERTARSLPAPGAVGFAQVTPEGWPQLTFGGFPTLDSEWTRRRWQKALDVHRAPWAAERIRAIQDPVETDWVSGSCLWMDKELFVKIGGFDESYFMYYEDIDLCLRAGKTGRKTWYCPRPEVLHLHGVSAAEHPETARVAYRQSQLRYAQNHRPGWEAALLKSYLLARSGLEWTLGILRNDPGARSIAKKVFGETLRS